MNTLSKPKLLELKKFNISDDKILLIEKYVNLLIKWNTIYSLTATINFDSIVNEHVIDGISIIPYLTEDRIIDVGSGMGVPGILAAICCPEKSITLLDSNNTKTAFLRQVQIELQLNNVNIITTRLEDYYPEKKYKIIISRAFAKSALTLQLCKNIIDKNGFYLLLKSKTVDVEIKELNDLYKNISCEIITPEINKILYNTKERYLLKITAKNGEFS